MSDHTQTNGHPEEPLFVVDDLAVSFDNGAGPRIQAVDGTRLVIYPRQTVAVVGESGCGKSVTAMTALRLVPMPPGRVDRGRIMFEGRNLLDLSEPEMRDVRGNEHRDDLPGADVEPEPGLHHR
jgi:ABC-type dipeptide/oligopeptide/nickel transport system ATPase component